MQPAVVWAGLHKHHTNVPGLSGSDAGCSYLHADSCPASMLQAAAGLHIQPEHEPHTCSLSSAPLNQQQILGQISSAACNGSESAERHMQPQQQQQRQLQDQQHGSNVVSLCSKLVPHADFISADCTVGSHIQPPATSGSAADGSGQQQQADGPSDTAGGQTLCVPTKAATAATGMAGQRGAVQAHCTDPQNRHASAAVTAIAAPAAAVRTDSRLGPQYGSTSHQQPGGVDSAAALQQQAAVPCMQPTGRHHTLPSADKTCPVKALAGIRMVWVSSEHRRRGLGTKLLEAAR